MRGNSYLSKSRFAFFLSTHCEIFLSHVFLGAVNERFRYFSNSSNSSFVSKTPGNSPFMNSFSFVIIRIDEVTFGCGSKDSGRTSKRILDLPTDCAKMANDVNSFVL